jgi:cytoskeletal protein CcmA (bactofilin family)
MAEISKQALLVENNQSFPDNNSGTITPSDLRSFNVDMIASTVNQTVYTTDSGSWNSKITQLNAFTASQQPSFTALNSFTASQLTINTGVNGFTQSATGRLNNLEAYTASFTTSVGIYDESVFVQNVNQINFMGNGITASYVSGKAVVGVDFTPLNNFTASTSTQLNALQGNFNSYTSSTNAAIAAILITTSSLATTGSNTFTENNNFTKNIAVTQSIYVGGNIYVEGGIEATYIKTIYETASVIYSSGSNQLGDALGDTQILSGSTFVEGELYVNKLNVTSQFGLLNAFTASQLVINSGYNQFTSSTLSALSSIYQTTASLNSYTASTNIRLNNIDATTASLNTSVSNLNTFSASQLLKDDTLALYTASVNQTTASLNTATQSLQSQVTTLGSFTGSYATTGSNTFIGNQIIIGNETITGSLSITGSLILTGSVYGNVISQSITSTTASIDLSKANFYTVVLPQTTTTRLNITNPGKGQTAMIQITSNQEASASFSSNVLQPSGFAYIPTPGDNKIDVLTLASFDGTNVLITNVTNLV